MIGSAQPLTIDYKRVNSLLADPAFQAKFGANSIRDVNDILWYFTLSRNEAVEASKDAVASVDANVLPEVQLSRLTRGARGRGQPRCVPGTQLLDGCRQLSRRRVQSKLTLLAMYFLREGAYDKAEMAIGQVASLDPRVGRTLSHRRSLEMLDYPAATDTYRKYSSWPSETHLAQARAMIEIGAYDEARSALTRPPVARPAARNSAPGLSTGNCAGGKRRIGGQRMGAPRPCQGRRQDRRGSAGREGVTARAAARWGKALCREVPAASPSCSAQRRRASESLESPIRRSSAAGNAPCHDCQAGARLGNPRIAELALKHVEALNAEARGVRRPEGAARPYERLSAAVSPSTSLHNQRRRY